MSNKKSKKKIKNVIKCLTLCHVIVILLVETLRKEQVMKKLITLIIITVLSLVSCEVDEVLEIDICCKFTEAGVTDYEIIDFKQCKNYEPNI